LLTTGKLVLGVHGTLPALVARAAVAAMPRLSVAEQDDRLVAIGMC